MNDQIGFAWLCGPMFLSGAGCVIRLTEGHRQTQTVNRNRLFVCYGSTLSWSLTLKIHCSHNEYRSVNMLPNTLKSWRTHSVTGTILTYAIDVSSEFLLSAGLWDVGSVGKPGVLDMAFGGGEHLHAVVRSVLRIRIRRICMFLGLQDWIRYHLYESGSGSRSFHY